MSYTKENYHFTFFFQFFGQIFFHYESQARVGGGLKKSTKFLFEKSDLYFNSAHYCIQNFLSCLIEFVRFLVTNGMVHIKP